MFDYPMTCCSLQPSHRYALWAYLKSFPFCCASCLPLPPLPCLLAARLRTIFHFIAPLHMAVNWQQKMRLACSASCSFFGATTTPAMTMMRARISISAHCACLHTNILRTCYRSLSGCLQPGPLLVTLSCHTYACKLYLCAQPSCSACPASSSVPASSSCSYLVVPAREDTVLLLDFICRGNCLRHRVAWRGACIDFIFAKNFNTHSSPPSPLPPLQLPLEFLLLFCNLSGKWQPFLRCSFACGRTFALLCVPWPLLRLSLTFDV